MRHPVPIFAFVFAASCSAIALSGGCSSAETHGMAPPLAGGTGGSGGATSTTSSHSSSHASSSSPASSSSTGVGGSAGGGGAGGGVPAHCSNLTKDGDETDVDCGGSCPPCPADDHCDVAADCQSLHCSETVCQAATCMDGIQNQGETDRDCGGPNCPGSCPDGKVCNAGADCVDKICTNHACAAPTCTDHQQNGDESDIDCGGDTCPLRCDPGQKCNGASDCRGGQCQQTCQCPLGMVIVPVGGGGAQYCIDNTEVNYAAYQVFYDSNPDTSSQPPYCQWNLNYTPTGDWPQLAQNAQQPVRYVNWCQADAYCRFAGKHLCGSIQGGAVATGDLINAGKDQWFNACSAQGVNDYPYGDTFSANACNGAATVPNPMGPWTTTTMICLGGEPNLFDMSGNVAEWEDGCDATLGDMDLCPARGGSFQSDASDLRCDDGGAADVQPRDYSGRDVGFRCCF